MSNYSFDPDPQYALDHCSKYLNRRNTDARHAFTEAAEATLPGTLCEAWRFPVVDTYGGGALAVADPTLYAAYNQVTFVYADAPGKVSGSVGLVGTFHNLYDPLSLARVRFAGELTLFWVVSVAVPKRQLHRYCFVVDGVWSNDPINPQAMTLPNGRTWSRFFTEACAENLVLEDWEQAILQRLAGQIAPLRTSDGQRFLEQYYSGLDNADEKAAHSYRFDESVGEVGFIDNLLAREEHHRLVDYKICLTLINEVLRQRDPFHEPAAMPDAVYDSLYNEMTSDAVHGWDTSRYGSPLFFLNLLRRHVCTGAFAHPKYGGNSAGAGWAYLEDRYRDANGTSLFKWRDGFEPPLGLNRDYLG